MHAEPFAAPPIYRKLATGYMSSIGDDDDGLVFPHRQNTQLRVSLTHVLPNGTRALGRNRVFPFNKASLEESLRDAKREVVEREIFQSLVKEAGKLPTISAKVSERLIVLDAAKDIELLFEMVTGVFHSDSLRFIHRAT